jgi:hypothetical protein
LKGAAGFRFYNDGAITWRDGGGGLQHRLDKIAPAEDVSGGE